MKPITKRQLNQKGYVEYEQDKFARGSRVEAGIGYTDGRSNRTASKCRVVHIKTGWVDDTRNIANKAKQTDPFIQVVKTMLGLEIWPEFYFTTERNYRIDYAIPKWSNSTTLKIAIEVNGGIWAKGNSGHSSGKGIRRDMDKANLLVQNGWRLICVEPSQIKDFSAVELIRKLVE